MTQDHVASRLRVVMPSAQADVPASERKPRFFLDDRELFGLISYSVRTGQTDLCGTVCVVLEFDAANVVIER